MNIKELAAKVLISTGIDLMFTGLAYKTRETIERMDAIKANSIEREEKPEKIGILENGLRADYSKLGFVNFKTH